MSISIEPGKTEVNRRGVISEIGTPIPDQMNAPHMIPVRFQDGTYAVLNPHGSPTVWRGKGSKNLNQALRNSATMPVVDTLATGVLRIYVQDKNGRKGIIRYHYGMGKEDREDYIYWS